jgi:DNA-binding transcriptional ArsR family regulator
MSEVLGITPSAVSQHLRILRQAGLVRNKRKGYWIPYEVDPAALERCGEYLSTVCACGCQGPGRFCRVELTEAEDKVEVLRKYERELKEELRKVQTRIEELRKKS